MTDAPKSALELVDGAPEKEGRRSRRRRAEADRRAEGGDRRGAIGLRSARRRAADPAPQQAVLAAAEPQETRRSRSSTAATWIGSRPIATPRSGRFATGSNVSRRGAIRLAASPSALCGRRLPAALRLRAPDVLGRDPAGRSRAIEGPGDVRDADRSVRSAAGRHAGPQAVGGMGARSDARVRLGDPALEPWRVRPRLGAGQARGRDGRAALHAAHRLCRSVVAVDAKERSSPAPIIDRRAHRRPTSPAMKDRADAARSC